MNRTWSILYRGPLSSCNYACWYCPFAKTTNSREELQKDARCLERFSDWVSKRPESIGILFTPWGEALVHAAYQDAICALSHLPSIRRVVIQTNLSCQLNWLSRADPAKLALWCTFHPTCVSHSRFVAQCRILDSFGVRYSVGVVGSKDALSHIARLRADLNPQVYLWVNALKRQPDYYSSEELSFLNSIDPLFYLNNRRHPSLARACRTGRSVFTVDGDGNMRRCHFVKDIIGNIYDAGFESALQPRLCPMETCGCHIGYVHLEELRLEQLFGENLLERIPSDLNSLATVNKLTACSDS
jgi:MoaA/NifB/PqqE/SkfB family radical SAM enzyme